jgi:hypothetical protein
MKKARKFWQDVELAICILMLRQSIQEIIRKDLYTRLQINKRSQASGGHDRILFRYHEVMMARIQSHYGHLHA